MRALCIDTCDQQPNTVGPLSIMLSVGLSAIANTGCDFGEKDGAVVGEARGERLLFHEVGEHAGVGCEASKAETIVGVDADDLALVGRELFCVALESDGVRIVQVAAVFDVYLQSSKHSMCLADNTHYDGTLLDGFLGVLDLEDAALGRAVLVSETSIEPSHG